MWALLLAQGFGNRFGELTGSVRVVLTHELWEGATDRCLPQLVCRHYPYEATRDTKMGVKSMRQDYYRGTY